MENDPEKRSNGDASEEGHLRNPVYNADEFHKVHGKPLGLISLGAFSCSRFCRLQSGALGRANRRVLL